MYNSYISDVINIGKTRGLLFASTLVFVHKLMVHECRVYNRFVESALRDYRLCGWRCCRFDYYCHDYLIPVTLPLRLMGLNAICKINSSRI